MLQYQNKYVKMKNKQIIQHSLKLIKKYCMKLHRINLEMLTTNTRVSKSLIVVHATILKMLTFDEKFQGLLNSNT